MAADDDRWLDILSGRDAGESADATTRREARALRTALLRDGYKDTEDPALDEQSLERLQFRLRREGLLGRSSRLKRWFRDTPLSAVAALLVLAIVLPITLQMNRTHDEAVPVVPDEVRSRSVVPAQTLLAQDPRVHAEQIASRLRETGLTVKISEFDGAWYVDTQLPAPVTEDTRAFLESLGLTVEAGQRLFIAIQRKTTEP